MNIFTIGEGLDKINFTILAGGNGKRLQPICDTFTPKPFIEIAPGKSLLRYSFGQVKEVIMHRKESLENSVDDKVTMVVLNKFKNRALDEVYSQVDQTITEQSTGNTFNAILRLVSAFDDCPDELLCILPCDQIIDNVKLFSDAISKASLLSKEHDAICLIGIEANGASDQLGYIQKEENGLVQAFFEKPSMALAQSLVEKGALINTSTIIASVRVLKNVINNVSSRADFVFTNQSFDTVVLEKNTSPMFAVQSQHSFIDVGTPETFIQGKELVEKNNASWSFKAKEITDNKACFKHSSSSDFSEQASDFAEYNVRKLLEWLPELQNKKIKILDFGCGTGLMTEMLRRYFVFAEISGCDTSAQNINIARANFPQMNFFSLGSNGQALASNSYDLIIASQVFHHIKKEEQKVWLKKLHNSLAQNGHFALFELNPLNLGTLYTFRNNPVEKGAQMLFPWQGRSLVKEVFGSNPARNFYSFFPRWFKFLRAIEPFLTKLPFGGLYACVARK